MVEKVAAGDDTTVLIQGESGTGKELVADLIAPADAGAQRGPFVEINCASLPENLLESELFGHERGAFTDAKAQKRGLFEAADGGTLFLDEIGELPVATQAKLLKVLEEMTFRRLGGTRDLVVDVRVIAATNKDLGRRGEAGRVPPRPLLPARRVPPARAAAARAARGHRCRSRRTSSRCFAARMRKPALALRARTERAPARLRLSGQRARAANVIERAVILSTGETIEPENIVLSGPTRDGADGRPPPFFSRHARRVGKPPTSSGLEREYIARLLALTRRQPHAGRAAPRCVVPDRREEDHRLRPGLIAIADSAQGAGALGWRSHPCRPRSPCA